MSAILQNINDIKEDILKHSPNPDKVKLVGVTKYVDTEIMLEAFNSGITIMGENRVQVLREKYEILKEHNIEWHLIGQLQKNKIKYIIDYISMIHSVDSLSLAEEIDKKAEKAGRTVDILLEVNISNEESKSGYSVSELLGDCNSLKTLKNINIRGLMTMAPLTDNEMVIRNVFRGLAELRNSLNNDYFDGSLQELSMGMSNDYKIALEEGATLIRLGTKIFK